MAREDRQLIGQFEYRQDLFGEGTMTAMVSAFQCLLNSITKGPEEPLDHLTLQANAQTNDALRRPSIKATGLHLGFFQQAKKILPIKPPSFMAMQTSLIGILPIERVN